MIEQRADCAAALRGAYARRIFAIAPSNARKLTKMQGFEV